MTKLYAYTDELSGSTKSYGVFHEDNGIHNACSGSGGNLTNGDSKVGYDGNGSVTCTRTDTSYEAGYAKFGYRHGDPEDGSFSSVRGSHFWKLDPNSNSTTRNTCHINISNPSSSRIVEGTPYFVEQAAVYQGCDLNKDAWLGWTEEGVHSLYYGEGNMARTHANENCLLRCEYNLENDFKLKVLNNDDDKGKCLKSSIGANSETWVAHTTGSDPSDHNPTNSEAVFDVQNRQINCGPVPEPESHKLHYIPRHSDMIDNISDDHNEKIPANIKAYGEKFFPDGTAEAPNYYKSWTFGKLMKDLCQNVEYDSEFCPEVSPPQNYCSYFDSTRPSLMIAGANGDQNICKHYRFITLSDSSGYVLTIFMTTNLCTNPSEFIAFRWLRCF